MSHNSQILDDIALRVKEIVNAETAVVALAESEGEIVHYAAAAGKHAEWVLNKKGAAATSGLCGTAFQSNQPVLVCRTEGDHRVRQDHAKALGIDTALAVPLYHEGKLLGALMAWNRNDGSLFDEEAERVLAAYAFEATPLVYQYQVEIQ
ncbi:MAG: GAF domain-containing protein [Aphanothece sp. CMT-3BRIN-NPC111]|nr:GAF domain-containing protein [Aphanothece sp. CMT-3BRIN-NPC111]